MKDGHCELRWHGQTALAGRYARHWSEHRRMLRWVEVKTDDIGGLAFKVGIMADHIPRQDGGGRCIEVKPPGH